jgi:hypothetical protein
MKNLLQWITLPVAAVAALVLFIVLMGKEDVL